MRRSISLIPILTLAFLYWPSYAKVHIVTSYGAVSDTTMVQTQLLQRAIDECSARGGGVVRFPAGTYISGTLFMRDDVMIELEHGATLRGSINISDYPDLESHRKGLIQAEGVHNVGICGTGTIDASGDHPVFQSGPKSKFRIYAVNFEHCTDISVTDVNLINASYWTLRFDDCERARVRGIRIRSVSYFNNDGIDIDGRDITVSDCVIDCIDDAICLKSYYPDRPCENISITGCIISSNCNAIKLGTGSYGGFRNIAISNCIVKRPFQNDYFDYKEYIVPGITDNFTNNSGLALEMVDGGTLDHVVISNITMFNTLTPIFIRLGQRHSNVVGTLRDVTISNITASSSSLMTCSITGIPGHPVENIKLFNIILDCPGGGQKLNRSIPEMVDSYPENKIFGAELPAYGLYIRHAQNVSLRDIQFNLAECDEREPIYLEDCSNIKINDVTTVTGSASNEDLSLKAEQKQSHTARMNLVEKRHFEPTIVKWGFRTQTKLLCDMASRSNIKAIDMVGPEKWDVVLGSGLDVSLADGVDLGCERGFADKRWHERLQKRYLYYLPILASKGIQQVVCYSGINPNVSREEALKICMEGLEPILVVAERLGIKLIMELQCSRPSDASFTRHTFSHYICDDPEWGAELCRRLSSDSFALLYDVWHMGMMGRDCIYDIDHYRQYIAHIHISGTTERQLSKDTFNYSRLIQALDTTNYTGYIGYEPDRIENNLENAISEFALIFNR